MLVYLGGEGGREVERLKLRKCPEFPTFSTFLARLPLGVDGEGGGSGRDFGSAGSEDAAEGKPETDANSVTDTGATLAQTLHYSCLYHLLTDPVSVLLDPTCQWCHSLMCICRWRAVWLGFP